MRASVVADRLQFFSESLTRRYSAPADEVDTRASSQATTTSRDDTTYQTPDQAGRTPTSEAGDRAHRGHRARDTTRNPRPHNGTPRATSRALAEGRPPGRVAAVPSNTTRLSIAVHLDPQSWSAGVPHGTETTSPSPTRMNEHATTIPHLSGRSAVGVRPMRARTGTRRPDPAVKPWPHPEARAPERPPAWFTSRLDGAPASRMVDPGVHARPSSRPPAGSRRSRREVTPVHRCSIRELHAACSSNCRAPGDFTQRRDVVPRLLNSPAKTPVPR